MTNSIRYFVGNWKMFGVPSSYRIIEKIHRYLKKDKKNNKKYKILIAADGRFSRIRFLADIKYYFHDYGQNAFVFNISHEEPHLGVALERFFPSGPLAVLPVKDSSINQSSVVWTVDSKISETQEFKENFQDEFKKKYSNFFGKLK